MRVGTSCDAAWLRIVLDSGRLRLGPAVGTSGRVPGRVFEGRCIATLAFPIAQSLPRREVPEPSAFPRGGRDRPCAGRYQTVPARDLPLDSACTRVGKMLFRQWLLERHPCYPVLERDASSTRSTSEQTVIELVSVASRWLCSDDRGDGSWPCALFGSSANAASALPGFRCAAPGLGPSAAV